MPDESQIVPDLFVGSKPRPDAGARVDAIVLCAEEHQPPDDLFGGAEVIRAPLDDDPRRTMRPNEIAMALRAGGRVARRLRAGRRVLVTCAKGRNRSALVAALAAHEIYGLSADDIVTRIRRVRGPLALSNPSFERLLRVVIDVRRARRA